MKETKKNEADLILGVRCPNVGFHNKKEVECHIMLDSCYAKSSFATRGVLLEGHCPTHGFMQCRLKDGKIFRIGGEEPYQKPSVKKRKRYGQKEKWEEVVAAKDHPKMKMRGSLKHG